MKAEIHDLIQGSKEWDAFRLNHNGASEASTMLGISTKAKRNELLRAKSTGIAKQFSEWVQENILDHGHEVEAMARPIVERIINADLYPITCSLDKLSASLDGLTMDEETVFEHKQWNDDLATSVAAGELPDEYMPQCQQILMLTEAKRVVFTVSDGTEENLVWMEVFPDQDWFERINAGWTQFEKDLAEYVHVDIQEKPDAEAILELPALFLQARGEITSSNMEEFGLALATSLVAARKTQLITDQDFSNAEAAAKHYRETCKKLMLAKDAMLSQTVTIGEASRMIDAWHEDLRVTALKLEKDVEKEKEAKKLAIIISARATYAEHISDLLVMITPIRFVYSSPDFAAAIKGKRLLSAMHDAVDTLLANTKIETTKIANDIRAKLDWKIANTAGYEMLLSDLQTIIQKPMEDFQLTVKTRISEYEKNQNARREAETARIRAEEEAKAMAKIDAEQAAERKRIADAQAKQLHKEQETIAVNAKAILEVEQSQPQTDAHPFEQVPVFDLFQMSAAQPAISSDVMIKLGEINARLNGPTVTSEFLERKGFHAQTERNAKLYRLADLPAIYTAIINHVQSVAAMPFQAAA